MNITFKKMLTVLFTKEYLRPILRTALILVVVVQSYIILTGGGLNYYQSYEYDCRPSQQTVCDNISCVLDLTNSNASCDEIVIPLLLFSRVTKLPDTIEIIFSCDNDKCSSFLLRNIQIDRDGIKQVFPFNKIIEFSDKELKKNKIIKLNTIVDTDPFVISLDISVTDQNGNQKDSRVDFAISFLYNETLCTSWPNLFDSYPPPSLGGP